MDRFSLEPYGIHLVMRRGMSLELENLNISKLSQGSFSMTQGRFDLPSGTYSIGPLLGAGSYGHTYQAIHTVDNRVYVIKVQRLRSGVDMIRNSIKEAIINIILERESEEEPDGPYVPRFYEIAYDPLRKLLLLRMERLHGAIDDVYAAATPEQNDTLVPQTLGDLAHILQFFHKRLRYNHRDLKSDNVGFVYDQGKYKIKLIDFGMSCLTWEGVQVSGEQYFPVTAPCFIPSRDLSQYMYELLYTFRRLFSPRLQILLEEALTFPLDQGICRMFEGCRAHHAYLHDWESVYDFLNSVKLKNPKAEPKEVYRTMLGFMGQEVPKEMTTITPHRSVVPTKQCMPEQIFNPKTRRCVKRSGKIGRKLMRQSRLRTPTPTRRTQKTRKIKACPADKTRNPVTQRCRYPCPSSQIRNPVTQRCVSRVGPVGRRLLAKGVRTSARA